MPQIQLAGLCGQYQSTSHKVLGVDGMSAADSANMIQFGDIGTPDHLWQLI